MFLVGERRLERSDGIFLSRKDGLRGVVYVYILVDMGCIYI